MNQYMEGVGITVRYKSIRWLSIALVCAFLMNMTACTSGKGAVPAAAVRTVSGEIIEHKSAVRNNTLHRISPDTLKTPMASSGLMQLFLDDNSFGIALYEKTREKYWYSLPASDAPGYDDSASTVTLDVLCGNTLYKLNSQDDCVQYGNIACDTLGSGKLSGFYVSYVMTADEATARKVSRDKIFEDAIQSKDFAPTDIAFLVRVTYELRDGNLYVSAQWKNLSENADAVVCDLSLLPFFGASTQGEKGDYFLLPDGCGTLVHTDVQDPDFSPIDLHVYGSDPASDAQTDTSTALFPASGRQRLCRNH